jgi:hypothetical protein
MTNWTEDDERAARRAFARLADELSRHQIKTVIDAPIERRFRRYSFKWSEFSAAAFHRVVSDCVHHVCASTYAARSDEDSVAAALALLEVCYTDDAGRGYECALRAAAADPVKGISRVLGQLVDGFKRRQRQQHINSTIRRHLAALSFTTKLALAQLLTLGDGPEPPSPVELGRRVSELPALIASELAPEDLGGSILGRGPFG